MSIVRGVRGAIAPVPNDPEAIKAKVELLVMAMRDANPSMIAEDIASILLTSTPDLTAAFPASGVPWVGMGFERVPRMSFVEVNVPSGLRACIRILIHWNTDRLASDVTHVYLDDAKSLRPDRIGG